MPGKMNFIFIDTRWSSVWARNQMNGDSIFIKKNEQIKKEKVQ